MKYLLSLALLALLAAPLHAAEACCDDPACCAAGCVNCPNKN
jgi:hypothetical protein